MPYVHCVLRFGYRNIQIKKYSSSAAYTAVSDNVQEQRAIAVHLLQYIILGYIRGSERKRIFPIQYFNVYNRLG